MTSLVAVRRPLEPLSMNKHSERQKSKRAAAAADYEQDGDFPFMRTSKRAKTDEAEPVKKPTRSRAAGKERATQERDVDTSAADSAPISLTTTTATKKGSSRQTSDPSKPKRAPQWLLDSPPPRTAVESSKIALPMSDTPIISRNKEMRKKGASSRRSSLTSRGRRASSLIESGHSAIPHRDVDAQQFYKHIESDGLPEPRRMRQLLTWCGERALAEKPSHKNPDSNAILYARAIQDQLLKDFSNRSDFSNWFGRDDDSPQSVPTSLKPNPRNIELDQKMVELEKKIQRLREEKEAWLAIRKPPAPRPPLFTPEESDRIILPDFDLLDPEEEKVHSYLSDETKSFDNVRRRTDERLRKIQSSLEFQIDQLADNVHKLEQRVSVAGKEADKVLKLSALCLKDRDVRERKSAGTKDMPIMEVLRSLSNILPEGGG